MTLSADNARRGDKDELDTMAEGLRAGDRRQLARAITLVESARPDHARRADALLRRLLPATGQALRVGVTGVPGVGKSTFIEALGLRLIDQGHRPAVLTVDPSSPRTGGSILGDKTRMAELSRRHEAYIRPSPSGGSLGGVARRTREAALLCEAAGHDIIIIETVGVGQSETAVSKLVDVFVLLLVPGAGDELQGIKKGVVELADVIVVNKADGPMKDAASQAKREYASALHLLTPAEAGWSVPVLTCSARTGDGLDAVWSAVTAYADQARAGGTLAAKRAAQAKDWMWRALEDGLLTRLHTDPELAAQLATLEAQVTAGQITPGAAADTLLGRILGGSESPRESSGP